ncbi:MAG TPA: hypothetical protein EYO31_08085 [Phycisphaerales bacterium]|nr:hypothetical protein [Phycisphaerales bacterium]
MSAENLIVQYEKYCDIMKKVAGAPAVERLSDKIGERLVMAPRGLTVEDGGTPGALIEFSLAVATTAKALSSHFGDTRSLVKVSLLHELGKLGDLRKGADLLIPQESDWHREKLGQMYKYNDACSKMNVAHRTLWMLSHLGFELTREEWMAINVSQGLHLQENQFYATSIDGLAAGLLAARSAVLHGS